MSVTYRAQSHLPRQATQSQGHHHILTFPCLGHEHTVNWPVGYGEKRGSSLCPLGRKVTQPKQAAFQKAA